MLKEIWSSAFIEDGEVRKPIVFHNGLNVVLGGEKGDNSIGKSSLLLVIDFVFGGNAYLKSDAVSHVGNHCIFLLLNSMVKSIILPEILMLRKTLLFAILGIKNQMNFGVESVFAIG